MDSLRRRIRRCVGPPAPWTTRPATPSTTRGSAKKTGTRRRNRASAARSHTPALPPPAGHPPPKNRKWAPGRAKPKPPPGPGSRAPVVSNGPVRLSIPPSASANKAPMPPAMAGTVVGQPPRKRLRLDDDPFGAVGDYAGGFLIKSAVELSAGYDTNPGRTFVPKGSPFYVIAPEFLAVSDWQRHAVVAGRRGSFTGYSNNFPPPTDGTISSAPVDVDRPDFTGHI